MNVESIIARWTHCYHVAAVINLPSVRRCGALLPAATLFRLSDRGDLLNCRRINNMRLQLQGLEVLVRNQIPLDPNSIDVGLTETFEAYVACLNERVFFWPGGSYAGRDEDVPTNVGGTLRDDQGTEPLAVRGQRGLSSSPFDLQYRSKLGREREEEPART
jgi:hypothetical protein